MQTSKKYAGRFANPVSDDRALLQLEADRGADQLLRHLEAMKMEHTLRAPADGRVKALKCAVGDFVQEGTELADFEAATAEMETGK
jgi:3-methylcrotonyl-CoA carboxylase alpha subunit